MMGLIVILEIVAFILAIVYRGKVVFLLYAVVLPAVIVNLESNANIQICTFQIVMLPNMMLRKAFWIRKRMLIDIRIFGVCN